MAFAKSYYFHTTLPPKIPLSQLPQVLVLGYSLRNRAYPMTARKYSTGESPHEIPGHKFRTKVLSPSQRSIPLPPARV